MKQEEEAPLDLMERLVNDIFSALRKHQADYWNHVDLEPYRSLSILDFKSAELAGIVSFTRMAVKMNAPGITREAWLEFWDSVYDGIVETHLVVGQT